MGRGANQKITLEVPRTLLQRARRETGKGITETVRAGLERLAAAGASDYLLSMRGKVSFARSWQAMKDDR